MNQGIPVNQVNQVNRMQQQQQQLHQAVRAPVASQSQQPGTTPNDHQVRQGQQAQQVQQAQQAAQAHRQQAALQQHQNQQNSTQHPQRQMTQQQMQRQRHALLFQKLKNYKFAETSDDILKKYATLQPSMEFHIYDNHYRFGHADGIIPRSSPLGKEFIKYIMREEIPDSLVEVIKDAGIQMYEGCVILNLVDHRSAHEEIVAKPGAAENGVRGPKSYRTVLKPCQLSIYTDLLYQTDSAQLRLSDQSSLLLEAEILTLTKRNIDLSVPLNPYHLPDYLQPEGDVTRYDAEHDTVVHRHRVNNEMYKFKPLHEDSVTTHHDQNEYEQMMGLFSETYKPNPNSVSLMNDSSGAKSSQFFRLRFIENYRRKMERLKAAGMATNLQGKMNGGDFSNGIGGGGSNGLGAVSSMLGLTPQQRLMIQQQRLIQQQQKAQMSSALNGSRANSLSNTGLGANNSDTQAGGSGPATPGGAAGKDKKPKVKRPRKQPTKKQQAAAAAAAAAAGGPLPDGSVASTPDASEPPAKKKRGAYKKKNKNPDQQQNTSAAASSTPQQPDGQPQQLPNNIMDMNFNIMGNNFQQP